MMGSDTWNTCATLIGILFLAFLGCEYIKDDAKIVYQTILMLINTSLSFVLGAVIISGDLEYYSYGTVEYSPLGWVFLGLAGMFGIMMIVTLLRRGVKPFEKAGSIYPTERRQPRQPEEPQRPRGWG